MNEPATSSPWSTFYNEWRRRRVTRVAVVYAIAGWVVIEVASTMLPGLHLPDWTVTFVIALVVLGFPIAVIMGWMFDLGPRGVERTAPVAGEAAVPQVEARAEVASKFREPNAHRPESAKSPPDEQADRRSIAVLPFVNMSGDAENEYFSDGISEEILNLLTKLPQLKVASRTSSFIFKSKEVSIPTVAKELGVGTVLEGSVRRAGDHVRITAQLIDADSDSHLWSETYDREMKDVFAIQDDIARNIAQALQVALGPRERRALQNIATADPQAYDFYLKGRKYLYAFTRRDFLHAISMFDRAIALDPHYALAYAGKADAYSMLYRYAEATPENLQRAEQASQRAIELDPDCAEAHTALGTVMFTSSQFNTAEKEFETAILINPTVFEPYLFYGRACLAQGDFEKAVRLFIRAEEVNPTDFQAPSFLAMVYRSLGRQELAQQADQRTLQIVERHVAMNPDDARALSFGASAYAQQGQRERAIEWSEAALQSRENEPHFLYNTGCAFAQLGDSDRALDLLERAVDLGWGHRAWIKHDSDLTSLQGNPRFLKLLERMH